MNHFVFTEKELPLIVRKRIGLINCPDSIKHLVSSSFLKWSKNNGPDWTVDRIKTIKQIVLNHFSDPTRQVPDDIWIPKSNDGTRLAGPWKQLHRYAEQSERCLKNLLMLLNIYTLHARQEPTPKSVEKFRGAVETESVYTDDLVDDLTNLIIKATKETVRKHGFCRDVKWSEDYLLQPELPGNRELDMVELISRTFSNEWGRSLLMRYKSTYCCASALPTRRYRHNSLPTRMGRVFCIPGPGLKDRWVCDFNKALDYCIHPMGKAVYHLVSKLPWDITFDERKCLKPLQEQLDLGLNIWSFDLSSATDRFPWFLQRAVLDTLCQGERWEDMVALYDEAIHQPAEMPDGSTVTWKQGQPLGAYPSFATFTLTHGLLLYALNDYRYTIEQPEFFVHGDDVVILNPKLARDYTRVMEELGVEISKFKTLSSNKCCLINSLVITKNRVMHIPKWKPITRKNAFGQLRNWGGNVLSLIKISDVERELVKLVASLPVALGGVGYNPQGLPLSVRIDKAGDFLFKEKNLEFDLSRTRRVKQRIYTSWDLWKSGSSERLFLLAQDLDQRSRQEWEDWGIPPVLQGLPDNEIIGKNAYSVNPDAAYPFKDIPLEEDLDEITKIARRAAESATHFFD